MAKQDVRLQVFVTEKMDDTLNDVSELMGLKKNEVVRIAIATYCAGIKQSTELVREYINTHGTFDSIGQLDGQLDLNNCEIPIRKKVK